jgi:PhoPQ-activated pathogenicity-related protein
MKRSVRFHPLVVVICVWGSVFLVRPLPAEETALDRYVAKADPTYSWTVARKVPIKGGTQFIVDLTSQTWRSEKDVNHPVWKHWLNVVVPDKPASKTAFLFIGGGANGGEAPQSAGAETLRIAAATGTVVAELKQVPNQPLILNNDGVPRKEDDFIAYTWEQFIKTGDDTWPARLPMVKSAVRAMDCVQELLASEEGGKHKVENFCVAGGSKRGWTTWCTAAVDKRVVAAVPIVIDVINVSACTRHHIASFGFYAAAIGDYVRHNLKGRIDDPRTKQLYAIEDPYSYRERLTMPKYIVNGSGDQYFPPDSSQFYFSDLPGEKYLRYVPNTDHGLKESDALDGIIAFYQTILTGQERPRYSWTFESDGSIRVKSATAPRSATLWHANNPKARDFRVKTIGKAYQSVPLTAEGPGMFIGKIATPEKGWTAFYVELSYDVGAPSPLKLSTAVRILPEKLPFADLDPSQAALEPGDD